MPTRNNKLSALAKFFCFVFIIVVGFLLTTALPYVLNNEDIFFVWLIFFTPILAGVFILISSCFKQFK